MLDLELKVRLLTSIVSQDLEPMMDLELKVRLLTSTVSRKLIRNWFLLRSDRLSPADFCWARLFTKLRPQQFTSNSRNLIDKKHLSIDVALIFSSNWLHFTYVFVFYEQKFRFCQSIWVLTGLEWKVLDDSSKLLLWEIAAIKLRSGLLSCFITHYSQWIFLKIILMHSPTYKTVILKIRQ